jgi:hypothetical protein
VPAPHLTAVSIASRLTRAVFALLAAVGAFAAPATAQQPRDSLRASVIYTGRSLGALGVRRAQDEHELITEQANAEGVPFKLVSHLAWRAPGIVILFPGQEPDGSELPFVLAERGKAERLESVPALISANVLLVQDPWRAEPDLLAMLERNPRRATDFPDLVPTRVTVSRLRTLTDQRVVIVELPGAVWPADSSGWTTGDMNRVDLLDSRLFELPLNLGQIGPRATLLRRMRGEAATTAGLVITADLGHQQGDLDLLPPDRARLDFTALDRLGYDAVVPFEFELSLGAKVLDSLRRGFPRIPLLAANVRAKDSTLFTPSRVIEAGPLRVGLIGLVNAHVRDLLPRGPSRDFTFEPPATAATREVRRLRAEGVTSIVLLSNLDAPDNAAVAQEVTGIDAIVADLPVRWAPEQARTRVDLPERPFARPGAPALVARSAANGVAVGQLDLQFATRGSGRPYLASLDHHVEPVTDRTPPDTALVREIGALATVARRPRGELMIPAFVDMADQHPELRDFDDVTRQGRVSKGMWEAFMARLLRIHANAEVSVIRRLDQFPPLIGKLHENEIGAWLWTEDQLVVLDVLGADLRAMLRDDARGELATSGIDVARGFVLGHKLDDQTYYRVATSDVLYEGARTRTFQRGRRVRRLFTIAPNGDLVPGERGQPLALKDFMFDELRMIRAGSRGRQHIDRIASLVAPDPAHVNLFSFTFVRPTLWVSLNQVSKGDGYGTVPESRVTARSSWVVGGSGRFVATHERQTTATDFGVTLAYARQGVPGPGAAPATETADDIKLDVTLRPSRLTELGASWRPFVRGLFDTEFTPTEDPKTHARNPRQLAVRTTGGYLRVPSPAWKRVEVGLAVENDLSQPNLQYGVAAVADFERRFGGAARVGAAGDLTYRLHNDMTYFLPSPNDTPGNLALRYNMVHELAVPLVDELSLSIAADFFFFQGKVAANRTPGANMQLRVGLTYDRLWKPRYQPFL